ncbi:polyketide cyclase / dehydrase and lipid transport [Rhodococcus sp. RS1C4]|nr:polyketide cyclase / dehydrase and lipid transport [Rhodococcus sp. RS1C4]OZC61414.1 polyketide cyclase / dehydrase and lipid transport [Rhodococcus sp. 06-621-2]OZC80989.1 polyketide cyclase / dehydrase and lipid transport [Rhodococcus sp. 06-418-1B]OZD13198.1 polyketide cyclase / dehydrase and lipid transport [Rhodococcus sp. 06-156-4C]OZD16206.1 polyketide cyclase / dehydrase and lipid transport [Rhodococcus sp. 06-156-3C]OZD17560.1 polyketide cyclase / dehydrase and lipid transport [Rho
MCEAHLMSSVQVADQTFVAAPGSAVAESLGHPRRWRRWWPDLRVDVTDDRADKGFRWSVEGALTGTMEVWLEPVPKLDGVVLHYFLHAEPAVRTSIDLAAENRRRRVAGKAMAFEVKRELEAGRAAGERPLCDPPAIV